MSDVLSPAIENLVSARSDSNTARFKSRHVDDRIVAGPLQSLMSLLLGSLKYSTLSPTLNSISSPDGLVGL